MTADELCGWWESAHDPDFRYHISKKSPNGLQLSAPHWSQTYFLDVLSVDVNGDVCALNSRIFYPTVYDYRGPWSPRLRRTLPPLQGTV